MRLIFLMLVMISLSIMATEFKWSKIDANYEIFQGEIGEREDKSKNSNLYLSIKENAAKEIYDTIQEKPIRNLCAEYEEPSMIKSVGNLTCIKTNTVYECLVGISLESGNTINAFIC